MLIGFRLNWLQCLFFALIVSGCGDSDDGSSGTKTDTSNSGDSMVADKTTEGQTGIEGDNTDVPVTNTPSSTGGTDDPGVDTTSSTDETDDPGVDTQSSTDDTADTEEDETDSSEQLESCSNEGVFRCVIGDKTARELCTGGVWVAANSCAEGMVCDLTNSQDPASCVPGIKACEGRPTETVCEGAIMHSCGENGSSLDQEECASAQHCELGLTRGNCSVCIPGDYECLGKDLRACNSIGTLFEFEERCETEALCNPTAGACTDKACEKGSYNCKENKLFKCNDGQTTFEEVAAALQCKEDETCDEKNGECDKCRAIDEKETKFCDPDDINTIATCSADGQEVEKEKCPKDEQYCSIDERKCVECIAEEHCADKTDECVNVSCKDNECRPEDIDKGEPCNGEGVCDSKGGKCVECIEDGKKDANCPSTTSYCQDNECVECTETKHCNANNANNKACADNSCALIYKFCDRYSLRFRNYRCDDGYGLCVPTNNRRSQSYCGKQCWNEGQECTPGTGDVDEGYKGICLNVDREQTAGALRCYFDGSEKCPPGLRSLALEVADGTVYEKICLRQ